MFCVFSRLIFVLVLFLCCISTIALAQDVNFTASVNKKSLSIDDQLQLTLTISGAQNVGDPELPLLADFEILSQGSSSQFSFINGKMSASKSFSYTLMPIKEGTLTIDPASIEIDGEILNTNPITIEVLPAGKTVPQYKPVSAPKTTATSTGAAVQLETQSLKELIFLEIALDKNRVYIGEQVIMTFKLYFRGATIDNLQYTPPVTKGFVTESMGQQSEYRDIMNGIEYNIIELKTALFPAREGDLTIEPAKLKCDLLVKDRSSARRRSASVDRFFDDFFDDSFFSPYKRYPLELESNKETINVQPLSADGKPKSFRGAVGTYDLFVEASPKQVKTGEPINILMKVSGSGNIGAIPEPVISDLKEFKTYESEVKTNITGRGREIAGEKTFQKMIIPQNDKITRIPAIMFSYFDPQKEQYKTITKDPIPITVLPAPQKEQEIVELIKDITPDEDAKQAVRLLAKDIQYVKTAPGRLSNPANAQYSKLWLYVIIVIFVPVMAIITSFFIKAHRTKLREDSAYAKGINAYKTAMTVLKEAFIFERQNKSKECYDTIARAVQKFISDKTNIGPGTISIDSLNSRKITQSDIDRIKTLLNTCDLARFGAGSFSPSEMKHALKEASHIIKLLEKKL